MMAVLAIRQAEQAYIPHGHRGQMDCRGHEESDRRWTAAAWESDRIVRKCGTEGMVLAV